jgi:hypothetical protein
MHHCCIQISESFFFSFGEGRKVCASSLDRVKMVFVRVVFVCFDERVLWRTLSLLHVMHAVSTCMYHHCGRKFVVSFPLVQASVIISVLHLFLCLVPWNLHDFMTAFVAGDRMFFQNAHNSNPALHRTYNGVNFA